MMQWLKSLFDYYYHWTTLGWIGGNAFLMTIPLFLLDEILDGWSWLALFGFVLVLMERNRQWMKSIRLRSLD